MISRIPGESTRRLHTRLFGALVNKRRHRGSKQDLDDNEKDYLLHPGFGVPALAGGVIASSRTLKVFEVVVFVRAVRLKAGLHTLLWRRPAKACGYGSRR